MRCPLCRTGAGAHFAEAHGVDYLRCPACLLTWADPAARLAPGEERARYETHENDPDDDRYRAFLNRLARPLVQRLEPGMEGLDYGSGPGPTLSVMLEERGFPMRIWDPYFAPAEGVLRRTYDFVTCAETVEHFFHPGDEFRRLDGLLRPGGWLGVMTGILEDDEGFADWWYVRDPTHVSFYRRETFRWIAEDRRWAVEFPAPTVVLFRKG